jgi:transcriptional accessory protein Tex/SPT6
MTGNIKDLLSDKETVKTLEFILGMAKDSYQKQLKEVSIYPEINKIVKYYQELNIKETESIINTIKEYQKAKLELKEKQESCQHKFSDLTQIGWVPDIEIMGYICESCGFTKRE